MFLSQHKVFTVKSHLMLEPLDVGKLELSLPEQAGILKLLLYFCEEFSLLGVIRDKIYEQLLEVQKEIFKKELLMRKRILKGKMTKNRLNSALQYILKEYKNNPFQELYIHMDIALAKRFKVHKLDTALKDAIDLGIISSAEGIGILKLTNTLLEIKNFEKMKTKLEKDYYNEVCCFVLKGMLRRNNENAFESVQSLIKH